MLLTKNITHSSKHASKGMTRRTKLHAPRPTMRSLSCGRFNKMEPNRPSCGRPTERSRHSESLRRRSSHPNNTCKILRTKYPHLTSRLLDYVIWSEERAFFARPLQRSAKVTFRPRPDGAPS